MSSKSNPEIPAFPMKRVLGGFVHNTPWVEEMLSQFAIDSDVEIKVMQRRSLPQLQLYWVVLHFCVENSENKYGRAEDLHDALKIALGYSRKVKVLGSNEVIVLPGSIAFGRMTQGDFKVYFDRAMAELIKAGYSIEAYLEEGEKNLARYKTYHTGSRNGSSKATQSRNHSSEGKWSERKKTA